MRRSLQYCSLVLCALLALSSCGDDGGAPAEPASANNGANGKTDTTGEQALCVGVRGNGPKIFAHFGAMARIHEHYGLIRGVAGGSSGSITAFITESAYLNPQAFTCGGKACGEEETAARIALLFKSILGYLEVLAQTDEAVAFQQAAPLVQRIQQEGIDDLIEGGQLEEARQALVTLLQSDDLADLINPEVIALLTESPNPEYHLQDLWGALSTFGSFAVDSDLILIRPGLLSFEAFAEKLGRLGSFYAAYGPSDAAAWQRFFEGCATPGRGMGWGEIAALDMGDGTTCGEHYRGMLTAWREALLADEGSFPSRIDDPIGDRLPALVSTSVLTGDAVAEFEQARGHYLAAEPYTFEVDFDDVKFGYWGRQEDLDRVAANMEKFEDAKTAKFLGLGQATWRTALSLSPAEPGLTRATEIDATQVSAGGWSDLAPTLVLKNLGCDKVVLVTRRGEVQGGFGPSVAALLGMTPAQDAALYDLDGESAVRTSLENADARWCTNWDGFGSADFGAVFNDAWTAPVETDDPFFTGGDTPWTNLSTRLDLPACTPGAP